MKKLLLIPLAMAVLLTGCAGRGDKEPEESAAAAHQVAPLTLSEEESALLDLIAGTDGEYGLYACGMGEDMTGCTIEVLSWEDGAWQTLAEGGLSSSSSETLRLGIVLSGNKITVKEAATGTDVIAGIAMNAWGFGADVKGAIAIKVTVPVGATEVKISGTNNGPFTVSAIKDGGTGTDADPYWFNFVYGLKDTQTTQLSFVWDDGTATTYEVSVNAGALD